MGTSHSSSATTSTIRRCQSSSSVTTSRPSTVALNVDVVSSKISFDRSLLLLIIESGLPLVCHLATGEEVAFGKTPARVIGGDWHPTNALALVSKSGVISIHGYVPSERHFVQINTFDFSTLTFGTPITGCGWNCKGTYLSAFSAAQTMPRLTSIFRVPFHSISGARSTTLIKSHRVTVMLASRHNPKLLILGTSNGNVLFLYDDDDIPRSLRSLYDSCGDNDALDRRRRGDAPDMLRDDGFTARELRDAGYSPSELLPLCRVPPMIEQQQSDSLRCDFHELVGFDVICEDKFGVVTFVRAQDSADIRVAYDDGTFNSVTTVDECLATDYMVHGAVRLLQWKHPKRRRTGSIGSGGSGGSGESAHSDTQTEKQEVDVTSFASDVSFLTTSADGSLLLCGSMDGSAFVVVVRTRRIWQTFPRVSKSKKDDNNDSNDDFVSPLTCGAWTHLTNDFCCIGSRDQTVRCYDVFDGECKFTVCCSSYLISCVRFSPDDRFVVFGSWDDTFHVVDSMDGDIVWEGKSVAEIVDIFVGDDDNNEALIVVTKEGELDFVPKSELGCGVGWRETRVLDVKYAVCSGTHARSGSLFRKLAGLEVLIRIVFEFLFDSRIDASRNVFSKLAAVSTLSNSGGGV